MSTPPHQDTYIVHVAQMVLRDMAILGTSLVYASVLTDDGFEVARSPHPEVDGGRFASMSSSVQALSDAVARELRVGASQYVIIAAEHGHVIQLRVPGSTMVLAAHFDHHETLGKALSVARVSADHIGRAMRERANPPQPSSVRPGDLVTGPMGEPLRPEQAPIFLGQA